MNGLNKVMLIGNLGADPEVRVAQSGLTVLTLRLATNDTWVDKDGKKQDRTTWHNVKLFGKRAEGLAPHLKKGERLYVEGRIEISSYEKDGQKHFRTDIIANEISFQGPKQSHANGARPSHAADLGAADMTIPF